MPAETAAQRAIHAEAAPRAIHAEAAPRAIHAEAAPRAIHAEAAPRAIHAEAAPRAIHATAVAIRGEALLICGPSGAGKSRLAIALIARTTRSRPITLIGDDRILLHCDGHGLVARPHPRIAGFLERRGLGLVAMPWTAQARVGAVVELGPSAGKVLPGGENSGLANLPHIAFDEPGVADARADLVLRWWPSRGEAPEPHSASESGRYASAVRKRLELVR